MNIAVVVVLGIALVTAIVAAAWLVREIVFRNSEDRKDLEDRLMALSRPDALVTHKALDTEEELEATYIDEAKEYELSHGGQLDNGAS